MLRTLRSRAHFRAISQHGRAVRETVSVRVHGARTGAKVLIGDDQIENWRDHIDLIAARSRRTAGVRA